MTALQPLDEKKSPDECGAEKSVWLIDNVLAGIGSPDHHRTVNVPSLAVLPTPHEQAKKAPANARA